jgi:predicted DNA-binding transcriptional regulator AlpA
MLNAASWRLAEACAMTTLHDVGATAKILGISKSSLNKWRLEGRGPRFIKIERRVRYSDDDIDAYLAARRRTSTSEHVKQGPRRPAAPTARP